MNKNLFLLKKYNNNLNTKNILFYGNCQINALKQTIFYKYQYSLFILNEIRCFDTNIEKDEFTNIIQKCDYIITQPIKDNYRNKDYLSTKYIINNSKKDSKIIIFDSCYFNFYYFDLTYIKFNDGHLDKPSDYHYNYLIECYKNNYSIDYYIDNYINNTDLKSTEELDLIAQNSLNEILKRFTINKELYDSEKVYFISIYDFIKDNYKDKLLFYTMNHPSKYVIQYISLKIIEILNLELFINYDLDFFNDNKCILYKCIQKNINFNITDDNQKLHDIIKLYYDTYREIPNLRNF
jgi:hypothetical protein